MTDVGICNLALTRIGVRTPIASLLEATPEAQACSLVYESARDAVLSSFPWNFATRRATLAALAGVTRSGWTYAYALPTDCLAPRRLLPHGTAASAYFDAALHPNPVADWAYPELRHTPFAIEDNAGLRVLLTSVSPAELQYTARVSEYAFSPLFCQALAWAVAAELTLALPLRPDFEPLARQRYEMAWGKAAAQSLNEAKEDTTQPESEFIRVRG